MRFTMRRLAPISLVLCLVVSASADMNRHPVMSPDRDASPAQASTWPAGLLPAFLQIQSRAAGDADAIRASAEGSFAARNPAHDFDIAFEAHGASLETARPVTFAVREYGGRPVNWEKWGLEGRKVTRRDSGRHVEEWYVNAPAGLEQGFTLPQPSTVDSDRAEIVIDVEGGWRPSLIEEGRTVALEAPDSMSHLRHGQLAAWDATGRMLPATMHVQRSAIVIDVETAGASYPVTIDPIVQQQKLYPTHVPPTRPTRPISVSPPPPPERHQFEVARVVVAA